MTTPMESSYPADWKRLAHKDWRRIRLHLRENDPEGAALFLQQSLEKFLKAYLLERGWKLKKTHELDALLEEACVHDPGLVSFQDLCERVSGYYLAERYPIGSQAPLPISAVERDVDQARHLIDHLFPEETLE
ncbi:MAG: HEPN domain-containing protein [Candidatus Tectomicrobia bacterium]|uniref:HEPN domain-containing protein n=1 Tax=Tectimicrobiota bacterium TaxID=2528274 RepID=A0A932GS34_UNCTE|nr:HEPN domain-containing protein [Candidatus Tectomicrobia bacterium]